MIEDKNQGIKIAEDPMEALVEETKKGMESKIRNDELNLEIDKAVLEYLKNKGKTL